LSDENGDFREERQAIVDTDILDRYEPNPRYLRALPEKEISKKAKEAGITDTNNIAARNGFKNAVAEYYGQYKHELETLREKTDKNNLATHELKAMIRRDLANLCDRIEAEDEDHVLSDAGHAFEQETDRLWSEKLSDFRSLQDRLTQATDVLDTFTSENGISRVVPTVTGSPAISFALLFAYLLIEAGVNGFFFLNATEQGVVGAIFEVLFFAPFNVISAALIGYYSLRYIRVKETWKRVLAASVGIGLALFNVCWNAYLSALRVFFAPDNFRSVTEILSMIPSAKVLEILDYQSVGLLVLGLSLAVLSCWKAYHIKDPYPGFSELWKERQAIEDELADERDAYLDHLDEIAEKHRSSLKNCINYFTECPNIYANKDEALQKEIKRAAQLSQKIIHGLKRTVSEFYAAYASNKTLQSNSLLREAESDWDIGEISGNAISSEEEKNFLFEQAGRINVTGSKYERRFEELVTRVHREFAEFLERHKANQSLVAADGDPAGDVLPSLAQGAS